MSTNNWKDEWELDNPVCPICGKDMIIPTGPKDSPILLVGGEPNSTECGEGIPFVGQSAGVLRSELGLQGFDLSTMRKMLLWHHPPAKGKGNKNRECLTYFINQVVQEAKDRKLVVLIGADAGRPFLDVSVEDVSGLIMKSSILKADILPCVSIGTVFSGGVGELRFAMHTLRDYAQKHDLFPTRRKRNAPSTPDKPVDEEIEDW